MASRSKNTNVSKSDHDARVAATVKITLRMNQAHMSSASAWSSSGNGLPVAASVYAVKTPVPGMKMNA